MTNVPVRDMPYVLVLAFRVFVTCPVLDIPRIPGAEEPIVGDGLGFSLFRSRVEPLSVDLS